MALRRFPDTISGYLLATVVSAEEFSSQVQVAFTAAQTARRQGATLGRGPARRAGIRGRPADDDRLPVLVAVSDNGPRMPGKATAAFLSASESPSTSGGHPRLNDQAWVESFSTTAAARRSAQPAALASQPLAPPWVAAHRTLREEHPVHASDGSTSPVSPRTSVFSRTYFACKPGLWTLGETGLR